MTAPAPGPVSAAHTPDYGLLAQQAAEAHLEACWAADDPDLEGGDGAGDRPESPAVGPFDGCETCTVREVLYAAWPVLLDAVAARLRTAGHHDAADLVLTDRHLSPTTTSKAH